MMLRPLHFSPRFCVTDFSQMTDAKLPHLLAAAELSACTTLSCAVLATIPFG
jgi:hypothetical protein